jgi:folate-binding protein YgfZ
MDSNPVRAGAVNLSHWGVMRVQGADAAKFLHGQLTQDVALMGLTQARLAAFCSAKGRMQASFVAWKATHDDILLACSAGVLPATLKRLSMFVLRAQCKLSDATERTRLRGVVGASAAVLLGDVLPWQRREVDGATVIRLPDALGLRRALCASDQGGTDPTADSPALSLDAWRWLEVHSGVPTIEPATVDRFVPQMLNLELIGGVDFNKGCYPGQEVVARSQYRGTVKRRMFVFDVPGPATAGQEVYDAADPGQPAGMVVQAASVPHACAITSALVEVKLASLEPGHGLHLGSPDGPALTRGVLPYDVPIEAKLPD